MLFFLKIIFQKKKLKKKYLKYLTKKLMLSFLIWLKIPLAIKALILLEPIIFAVMVINFSLKTLNKKGTLVCKLFMGEDFLEVKNLAKKNFKKVDFFKPESSRSESKETYIICSLLKTL